MMTRRITVAIACAVATLVSLPSSPCLLAFGRVRSLPDGLAPNGGVSQTPRWLRSCVFPVLSPAPSSAGHWAGGICHAGHDSQSFSRSWRALASTQAPSSDVTAAKAVSVIRMEMLGACSIGGGGRRSWSLFRGSGKDRRARPGGALPYRLLRLTHSGRPRREPVRVQRISILGIGIIGRR